MIQCDNLFVFYHCRVKNLKMLQSVNLSKSGYKQKKKKQKAELWYLEEGVCRISSTSTTDCKGETSRPHNVEL